MKINELDKNAGVTQLLNEATEKKEK